MHKCTTIQVDTSRIPVLSINPIHRKEIAEKRSKTHKVHFGTYILEITATSKVLKS
jgi:hypothetical protein